MDKILVAKELAAIAREMTAKVSLGACKIKITQIAKKGEDIVGKFTFGDKASYSAERGDDQHDDNFYVYLMQEIMTAIEKKITGEWPYVDNFRMVIPRKKGRSIDENWDSGDDIEFEPGDMKGNGTFHIRKGDWGV